MSISLALYAVLGGGIAALAYALVRTLWIYKQKVSDQSLKEIGGHIADGAMAFLRREYLTLLPFIAIVAVFLAIGNNGALRFQSLSFLFGALASMSAGYIGMRVATRAN